MNRQHTKPRQSEPHQVRAGGTAADAARRNALLQAAKTQPIPKPKKNGRPYSLAYTAPGGALGARRYLLSGIPAQLWISFSARAKREHIAKRQVLLQLVEEWTKRPDRER